MYRVPWYFSENGGYPGGGVKQEWILPRPIILWEWETNGFMCPEKSEVVNF